MRAVRCPARPVLRAAARRRCCGGRASADPECEGGLRRPKRIILVRHGESLGNVDESAYGRVPDWRIPLTAGGVEQAREAGRRVRAIVGDEPLYVYVSPYERCMQTLRSMSDGPLGDNRVSGRVREEPRLIEQQFGNFQVEREISAAKDSRRDFGRFFYRFPDGESGFDVYNRVTSFIGTLWRDWRQEHFRMNDVNVVLVTHGLTIRLFLMRWFQYSVADFEETVNPPNCGVCVMNLRTGSCGAQWYELSPGSRELLNLPAPVASSGPGHATMHGAPHTLRSCLSVPPQSMVL
eukprot:TRINITY_DN42723_c0_g1_i1.p1 TRINITY_DN42723_c0_g1~~TRINITY_DN42723_c0_g1_i1.p1  ORF type:complete len:315 (+),score=86.53 TRINITY_DN42723_c0_g1_i1:68-946(+)